MNVTGIPLVDGLIKLCGVLFIGWMLVVVLGKTAAHFTRGRVIGIAVALGLGLFLIGLGGNLSKIPDLGNNLANVVLGFL